MIEYFLTFTKKQFNKLKHINRFNESFESIPTSFKKVEDGSSIDYELFTGEKQIGGCRANYTSEDGKVEILGLLIHPEMRNQGLGQKFLQDILKDIEKKFPKREGIYLEVEAKNKAAVKLYQNNGFKEIGRYSFMGARILEMKK